MHCALFDACNIASTLVYARHHFARRGKCASLIGLDVAAEYHAICYLVLCADNYRILSLRSFPASHPLLKSLDTPFCSVVLLSCHTKIYRSTFPFGMLLWSDQHSSCSYHSSSVVETRKSALIRETDGYFNSPTLGDLIRGRTLQDMSACEYSITIARHYRKQLSQILDPE